MSAIVRPYTDNDAEQVMNLIDVAFHFSHFTKSPRLREHIRHLYLHGLLMQATYARVAERDGQVIGLLMAQVDGQELRPDHAAQRRRALAHGMTILATGAAERHRLRMFFRYRRAYKQLRNAVQPPVQDEVLALAVHPDHRRQGIGSRLFAEVVAHLHSHGRTHVFHYSDSLGAEDFYERRGLELTGTREVHLEIPTLPRVVIARGYTGWLGPSAQ